MITISKRRIKEIKHNYDQGQCIFPKESYEERQVITWYWKQMPYLCNLRDAIADLEESICNEIKE